MNNIVLVGGGGHCSSCIDVIESQGEFQILGIVVPSIEDSKIIMNYPILGSDNDLAELVKKTSNFLIAVGQIKSAKTRQTLFSFLKQVNASFPVHQAPSAYCSRHAKVGEGTILMHGCVVNVNSRIGVNCIINSQTLIEHDVEIGDHCHISTGARINGNVKVGTGSFVGSGAVIKEGIEIGDNVVVGAGRVVLNNVASGQVLRAFND